MAMNVLQHSAFGLGWRTTATGISLQVMSDSVAFSPPTSLPDRALHRGFRTMDSGSRTGAVKMLGND